VSLTRTVSDTLFRRPNLFLALLLAPPLIWLGIAFLGSLSVFLFHSFFSIDEFSGFIKYELTLSTFAELFRLSNFDVIVRSLVMATAVTLASVITPSPISRRAMPAENGKPCSISWSCCRCGPAIS
jgi:putative spermidine/putrescine transport system permease protein